MNKGLMLHLSNYSIGNLLVTLSGFISFPIFTRVFSVDEYGILNLVSATLGLLFAISKLGIQHSIVRFYGEAKAGRYGAGLSTYLSTTLFCMTAVALGTTLLWAAVSHLIPVNWWSDPRVRDLFLLTSVLLVIRTVDSCLSNMLRAEERSGLLNVFTVIKRYGALALVLLTLYYLARDLYGYYWATIIAETIATIALFAMMARSHRFSPSDISPTLFRKMLAFGIPMIAFELSGIVLNIGDRYVIEAMLGTKALGTYSAGYNFCQYVQTIFLASLSQALMPMYMRHWEEKGAEETGRFLRQTMHYYLMLAIPLVAGVSVVGGDVLVLLASEKYQDGAAIIPYVVAGMAIDAMLVIAGAGLYIHKRTRTIATFMAVAAILNIALNLVLIPHFGITGAAIATLVSYGGLIFSTFRASEQLLPMGFPWRSALKFGALSIVMYAIIVSLSFESRLTTITAQIVGGIIVYSALVLGFDRQARTILDLVTARLRRDA